ncbi:hypothetical protein B296_00043110 [Ensete ventricosum]|uniref:GED domain-containing protein n=1 Tax=Ensete ventricosum TaxID=4639 RepID=A0A426ZFZ1_ENSVE|nr:hypothetical protein B296_00043110 [Ensete ventricosum]
MIEQAVVLCQVEKAKEDMLNQLYSSVRLLADRNCIVFYNQIVFFYSAQSTARIEELLQEDQNVKRKRERIQRQSSLLSKLTRQLSIHDNQAAAASWSDGSSVTANGSVDGAYINPSRSSSSSRRHSNPTQNGDVGSGANSGSRRTPNRMPPPAPPQGSSSSTYGY